MIFSLLCILRTHLNLNKMHNMNIKCFSASSNIIIYEKTTTSKLKEMSHNYRSCLSPIIAKNFRHMQETDITNNTNVAYHSNISSSQLECKVTFT